MKFLYEDLLSGDNIYAEGIGHFRSPKLKELAPTTGIGSWMYTFYLNILAWEKEDFLKYVTATLPHLASVLQKKDNLGVFDMMTLQKDFRMMLHQALSFFIAEDVVWEDKSYSFLMLDKKENQIGAIDRNNFDEAKDMALQMNYINLGKSKDSEALKFNNKKTKALWDKAQKHLKEQSKNSSGNKNYNIGNIISKLCAAGIGYTYHNIYDLTIYQMYDCFFQYAFLRAASLNEKAFANHGGKKFDIQDWLKPITHS